MTSSSSELGESVTDAGRSTLAGDDGASPSATGGGSDSSASSRFDRGGGAAAATVSTGGVTFTGGTGFTGGSLSDGLDADGSVVVRVGGRSVRTGWPMRSSSSRAGVRRTGSIGLIAEAGGSTGLAGGVSTGLTGVTGGVGLAATGSTGLTSGALTGVTGAAAFSTGLAGASTGLAGASTGLAGASTTAVATGLPVDGTTSTRATRPAA